jgi:ADP-ribose pyrophosphatase YjhB (NUDIX family)
MHPHEHRLLEFGYCPRCGGTMVPRFQEDRDRPTCPDCGFIHYLDPKVAVAVVIGDAGAVVLGRRLIEPGKGRWSFPSGYVNRGEVLEEAARREVHEEVGVSIELHGLVGAYSQPGEPVVLLVYAGSIRDGQLRPDGHEVSEVQRFALDALPEELAFPHDRRILADWKRAVQTGRLIAIT